MYVPKSIEFEALKPTSLCVECEEENYKCIVKSLSTSKCDNIDHIDSGQKRIYTDLVFRLTGQDTENMKVVRLNFDKETKIEELHIEGMEKKGPEESMQLGDIYMSLLWIVFIISLGWIMKGFFFLSSKRRMYKRSFYAHSPKNCIKMTRRQVQKECRVKSKTPVSHESNDLASIHRRANNKESARRFKATHDQNEDEWKYVTYKPLSSWC